MFLIKGENIITEEIASILLSVDMKDEKLLLLFDDFAPDINLNNFNTINRVNGKSEQILINIDQLVKYFNEIKFSASLPSMVFYKSIDNTTERDIKNFLNRGSKHKYLKAIMGRNAQWISIVDSFEEIKDAVQKKDTFNSKYNPRAMLDTYRGWVLQDAVEEVATFDGYKFHLNVLLIVVVRDKNVTVFINNYHTYIFSADLYHIKKIKDEDVSITHKRQNSKNAFFPMDLPDRWTAAEAKQSISNIKKLFTSIFKKQQTFKTSSSLVPNGYEVYGADIIFNKKHDPFVLEINHYPAMYQSYILLMPEIIHIGLGGAPLKLFSNINGTPHYRVTPFTESLTKFYNTSYKSETDIRHMFRDLFHTSIKEESDRAYIMYQKMNNKKAKRTTRKNKRRSLA